jgi:hypothetical protein
MAILKKGLTGNVKGGAMDYMQMLGNAKKEVQASLETTIESFETSFSQAVKMLGEFANSQNQTLLKQCAGQFLSLIQQKPSRVEPYVYMSYILFLFNKKEEALKYLKLSEAIDPNYKFIKEVKTCIYS